MSNDPTQVSDETLVQQVVRLQDVQAFEQLMRRHQTRMLYLQRRFVRDPALAEDLCQETFFRAWDKLETFKGSGSFAAWLTRLGYNIFLQHRRKSSKTADLERPYLEENGEQNGELATRTEIDSATRDELPDLPRLLAILPETDQMVLVLSYGQGLSVSEISEVLDVPAGTIKSQIHRAKEKIRQHFNIGVAA
jgi:RNA polymerase sigma factor (sigma-70 family)